MSGMTLTEFLLARIAEDEDAAAGVDVSRWASRIAPMRGDLYPHVSRQHPGRVLADCEAKRAIVVDLVKPYIAERRRLMGDQPSWSDEHPDLLLLLALPYADHPDYRDEWRPN